VDFYRTGKRLLDRDLPGLQSVFSKGTAMSIFEGETKPQVEEMDWPYKGVTIGLKLFECNRCQAQQVVVLQVDTSAGEYFPASFCLNCWEHFLDEAKVRTRGLEFT
jgi:hypothetical protein